QIARQEVGAWIHRVLFITHNRRPGGENFPGPITRGLAVAVLEAIPAASDVRMLAFSYPFARPTDHPHPAAYHQHTEQMTPAKAADLHYYARFGRALTRVGKS